MELGDLPDRCGEPRRDHSRSRSHSRTSSDFRAWRFCNLRSATTRRRPRFKPHNYVRDLVAYTGTHDNDTAVGWWTSGGASDSTRTPEDVAKEHAFARAYLGFKDEPIHWVMIRAIHGVGRRYRDCPVQDVLGLGSEARMNLPGTASGNWRWRCNRALLPRDRGAAERTGYLYDR